MEIAGDDPGLIARRLVALLLAMSAIGAVKPANRPAEIEQQTPLARVIGQELLDDLRITTDEIWHVGNGSIEGVIAQEEPAMILTRVAIGEAPYSINDRIYIMWLIRLRAELGYKNARHRGWNPSQVRWGTPTTIQHEVLCIGGCQFSPIRATHGIYFPANIKEGSPIRMMVHPGDDQIAAFLLTLDVAREIIGAPITEFPEQLKGYDAFRSPSVDWVGTLYYQGGLRSERFFAQGNIWRDEDEVDNAFWDLLARHDCSSVADRGYCAGAIPAGALTR